MDRILEPCLIKRVPLWIVHPHISTVKFLNTNQEFNSHIVKLQEDT